MSSTDVVMQIIRGLSNKEVLKLSAEIAEEIERRSLNVPVPQKATPRSTGKKGGRKPSQHRIWTRSVERLDFERYEKQKNLMCLYGQWVPWNKVNDVPDGTLLVVGMTKSNDNKELVLLRKRSGCGNVLRAGDTVFAEAAGKNNLPVYEDFVVMVIAEDMNEGSVYYHPDVVPYKSISEDDPTFDGLEHRASAHIVYALRRLGM